MLGHDLYPNNCPHRMGIWAPSKICLVGPTRVHNPNSISIGSAVFAQFKAEGPYDLQWAAHFPLKIAIVHEGSGPHLTCFPGLTSLSNPNDISIG